MISIAIDGYARSGKGELAEGLAKKLKLKHLDTGAILRAMGLYFFRNNITEIDESVIDRHFDNLDIEIDFDGDRQLTKLGGVNVESEIRQEVIGSLASKIAPIPKAMMKLIDISRDFAKKFDCVLDGRNITSEVLPDADVKFFLTASLECRTERGVNFAKLKGQKADYNEIYESLKERDFRDTHREFSPMIVTEDSVVVDTTNLNIEETLDYCMKIATQKLKALGKL